MPVTKIPVVHKFGIISHNQRLELQERLLKQAIEQASSKASDRTRNPNELSESFVKQFNEASTVEEKEKCLVYARQQLERLKRKAGIRNKCQVDTKQMDEAWVDLTVLSQCKGVIQEESLDVLLVTLDQASLSHGHVRGLFFLAETSLYWLRTDAINSPYLRVSEIKLLKMAKMIFMRLFYHHMVGDLRGHKFFKSRLYSYLDGLTDYQEAYSPYPNAHICLRYVIEVGKVILMDDDIDPADIQGRDNSQGHFQHLSDDERPRSGVSAVSRSVHDLSPTLWHCLDVWRCVCITGRQLPEALSSLARCGLGISLESWVDSTAALVVINAAARTDLSVVKVLQSLACGEILEDKVGGSLAHSHSHSQHIQVNMSGDKDERQLAKEELSVLQNELEQARLEGSKTPRKVTRQSQRAELIESPDTGKYATLGTTDSNRERVTPTTYRNSPLEDTPGLQGWSWEVGILYTEVMTELVISGTTSAIQKQALLGKHKHSEDVYHTSRPPLFSAGLLDLLHFHVQGETLDTRTHDWSWRIRYTAVQGLVQICRCLAKNKMVEGLRDIAWSALLDANAHEGDERVLEALKVGQVSAKEAESLENSSIVMSMIGSRLADGLAKRYLPPVIVSVPTEQAQPRKKLAQQKPQKINPLRTSLRDEQHIASLTDEPPIPDFNTRTSKDLMRIVQDQWRKELQEKLLQEDADKEKVENISSADDKLTADTNERRFN